jgi:thymidine kinase
MIMSNRIAKKKSRRELMPSMLFVTGCGGSGKTMFVIREGDQYEQRGYKVLYITSKHKIEEKSELELLKKTHVKIPLESSIKTHDGLYKKKAIAVYHLEDVSQKIVERVHVVIIDEAWMIYDIQNIRNWYQSMKKVVIISSITKDYTGRTFHELALASSHATKKKELAGVCKECGEPAFYDHRITKETSLLVVSNDSYQPLCGICFYSKPGKCSGGEFISVCEILKIPLQNQEEE